MMHKVPLDKFLNLCSAHLLSMIPPVTPIRSLSLESVTHDSRNSGPHSIFVALVGEHHNGENYIPAAIEKGAQIIVARPEKCKDLAAEFPTIYFVCAPMPRAFLPHIITLFYPDQPQVIVAARDKYMVGSLEDRIQILELLRERGVPFVSSASNSQGPGFYNNPPLASLRCDGHSLLTHDDTETLYMEAVRLGADVTEGGSSYHRGEYGPFRHDEVLLAKYRAWHRGGKAGWLHEKTKMAIHAKMLAEIAELQALATELDPTSPASTS